MLSPVSESYLRRLLAEMEIPVEPPFGGVRQKTFEELERSLLEMEEVYSRATESGDRDARTTVPERGDSGQRPRATGCAQRENADPKGRPSKKK